MINPTNCDSFGPDWLDLQSYLRGPWEQFARGRLQECWRAADRPLNPEVENSINAAVRSYSRGGGWPSLTDDEQRLLGARLHWAMCWTSAVLSSGENPPLSLAPEWDAEALIEWLLIQAWQFGGAALTGRSLT